MQVICSLLMIHLSVALGLNAGDFSTDTTTEALSEPTDSKSFGLSFSTSYHKTSDFKNTVTTLSSEQQTDHTATYATGASKHTTTTATVQDVTDLKEKRRNATYIFYCVACGLTVPLLGIFIVFHIRGLQLKDKMEKERGKEII